MGHCGGGRSACHALVGVVLVLCGCGDSGNPSARSGGGEDASSPVLDGAPGTEAGNAAALQEGGAVPDGSVPVEAGAFVCAGRVTQSCAACTACDRCPGCSTTPGAGACGGTPKSCSTCTGLCNGCPGCNPGLTCVGDNSGVTCAECDTAVSCLSGHCQGCAVGDGGACTGTLTPCSALNAYTDISCAAQVNCKVSDIACTGTPYPCSANNQGTCGQELGCSWQADSGSAAACTGTVKPCAEIPVSECAAIASCGLVPANGAASCDPGAAACFACGGSPDAGPANVCAPPSSCCGATSLAQTCVSPAACATAAFATSCDGAEDCAGAGCCVSLELTTMGVVGVAAKGTATCAKSCPVDESSGTYYSDDSIACHSRSDCATVVDDQFGVPQPNCCVAAGFAVGECVSDTFKDIFQMGGGTCD